MQQVSSVGSPPGVNFVFFFYSSRGKRQFWKYTDDLTVVKGNERRKPRGDEYYDKHEQRVGKKYTKISGAPG